MKYLKIIFLTFLINSGYAFAQESEVQAPSNLDKLLELVKEGKSQEQGENKKREAEARLAQKRLEEEKSRLRYE